jgi:hypothetical protein
VRPHASEAEILNLDADVDLHNHGVTVAGLHGLLDGAMATWGIDERDPLACGDRFADEIAALRAALVEEALQRLTDVSQEIEAALAEPEQEPVLLQCTTCGTVYAEGVPPQVPVRGPVAYMHKETGLLRREIGRPKGADWDANYWEPLYTHPPKRKPLTEEEIHDCFQQRHRDKATERRLITRAIERAHGVTE